MASLALPQLALSKWQSLDRWAICWRWGLGVAEGGVSEGQGTNWIRRLCPAVASPRVPEIWQLVCGAQRDGSLHHLQTGPLGTQAPPSLGSRKSQSVCVSATPSNLSLGRCQCTPPVSSARLARLCRVWGSVCGSRPCSLQPPRTVFPWLLFFFPWGFLT